MGLKLKNFAQQRKLLIKKEKKKEKKKLTVRKYLQFYGKRLISKIHIQPLQFNLKNPNFQNEQKTGIDTFPYIQMANSYVKRCSIPFTKEIQIKTSVRLSPHTSQNGYHQKEYK